MTTFIKALLRKDKTNIDKYKVAANIMEYHSKSTKCIRNHHSEFEINRKL